MNLNLILPLILIVGMFWFMGRQQKKQRAAQEERQNNLAKGASVVTIGGLHAVVDAINKEDKTVDLDAEGVILTFDMAAIRTVLPQVEKANDAVAVEDLKPLGDEETVDNKETITSDADKPSEK
ncbi:preprotein translocase subunit YajC [Leuconostoc palmae]|uniref:preprotein translocase subunit YajC n=1 Tax=Leuconostoc palmae TaxID=501487 RepID=UPI001C7D2221|nr:preprotein translocase subunit YajC [Leuconostoc palmae]